MILLFTDYGSADPYVGQVKAAIWNVAPAALLVDLLHEAPNFNVRASAHLLAALASRFQNGNVCLAVVDPGVGSTRHGVVMRADGIVYVAPDNGLLATLAARAAKVELWRIEWRPEYLPASFHGRDLFAPIAARIEMGAFPHNRLADIAVLEVSTDGADLGEIIYLDHYGNAMTGLRAAGVAENATIRLGAARLAYAPVFSAVPHGQCFWYRNSIGLVEIAANGASAAHRLGLRIGYPLSVEV